MGRVRAFFASERFGQPASETTYPQGICSGNSITTAAGGVLPLPLRIVVKRSWTASSLVGHQE
ncbi:MAG: hypothetical protein H0Z34_00565 [Brevibacillus sp.]|nr:hypothetical protein [Brevibacillus sp.]